MSENPGYHISKISKGELGEVSKIREELEELEDAILQDVRLMALLEASDLVGAIKAYLTKHHPGYTLQDLDAMSSVTSRAFRSGKRK